jgi:hypothetical protein
VSGGTSAAVGAPARRSLRPDTDVVLCHDAPGSQSARKSASQAHLRRVESMLERQVRRSG